MSEVKKVQLHKKTLALVLAIKMLEEAFTSEDGELTKQEVSVNSFFTWLEEDKNLTVMGVDYKEVKELFAEFEEVLEKE